MRKTLIASLFVLSGCGPTTVLETADSPLLAACLQPPGRSAQSMDPMVFRDDRPVEIVVRYKSCLSSSCDTNRMSSCTVAVDGNALTISSEFSWDHTGGACTADCGFIDATCTSPALPRGEYDVFFGSGKTILRVESATAAATQPCINND